MGNKLDPLVFIDENINKDVYIDVLKQNLLGFVDVLTEEGFQGIIFQQDNAHPHIICDKSLSHFFPITLIGRYFSLLF